MKEKLTANVLFSGVGCQERGMLSTNLFDLDVVTTSEIDKDAVLSYAGMHCGLTPEMIDNYNEYPSRETMAQELADYNVGFDFKNKKPYDWNKLARRKANTIHKYWLAHRLSKNRGDITLIDKLPYADLWTYSFPCQDISVSGKQGGLNGTRSGLLYEVERLLEVACRELTQPKYLLLENVKNLVGKKFIADFNEWLCKLDKMGYATYWQVINSKDCGIPQNRERVFALSIRKDIDNGTFEFPKPFDNGLRLKDFLEQDVEEKYYLSNKVSERFKLTDDTYTKNVIGTTKPSFRSIGQRCLVYSHNGVVGALCETDYKQPHQIISVTSRDNTNRCIQLGSIETGFEYESTRRYYSVDGVSPTLNTCQGGGRQSKVQTNQRLRKLTPLEYWKLMGLTIEDYTKARSLGMSDCSLYKQAGNGIVTTCVQLIMEHLYKAQYDEKYICTDEIF